MAWIPVGEDYYGQSSSGSPRVDIYICPHCKAKHHAALGKKPMLPFCWKCKEKV